MTKQTIKEFWFGEQIKMIEHTQGEKAKKYIANKTLQDNDFNEVQQKVIKRRWIDDNYINACVSCADEIEKDKRLCKKCKI